MDADPGTEAAELSFEDMFELYESPLGLDELDDAEQIDRILDAFENAAGGVVGRDEDDRDGLLPPVFVDGFPCPSS